MAGITGEKIKIVTYDTSKIDFISPIKAALGLGKDEDLSQLHQKFSEEPLVTRETDSKTVIHRRYYENIGNTDFYNQYQHFVHNVVSNVIDGSLIVQRVPSFRVHLPNNKAVGEYHHDSDFGHQPGAINFWIPLTDAHDSNTIHVGSAESGGPKPVNVKYGEALAFDAINSLHGNEINRTGQTRISFDFRVVPERDYVESSQVSINTMARLALGDYYLHASEM